MKYVIRLIKYSSLFFLLLSMGSCKKFLEEKIYSQYIPDNFYKNPEEASGAIRGIINEYSDLANYDLLVMTEYETDNVVPDAARVLKQTDNYQFAQKTVKSTNALIQRVYANLYTSIYYCNEFIYRVENTVWASSTDSQRPQFLAEAYTLRAMGYFHLVRLFGPVPLVIDVKDNVPEGPLKIGRTAVDTIYNQIVSDLTHAKSLFTQEGARSPGYPSKILCRLLLSEVYLTMSGEPLKLGEGYMQAAKDEVDTMIHQKASGITVPDFVSFRDLFSVAYENKGEILFSGQNYGIGSGQIWPTAALSYGALSYDLIRDFNASGSIDMNNPNRVIRGVDPNTTAYDVNSFTDPSKFIDSRFYPTFWPYRGAWNATTKLLPAFYNVLNYLTTPSLYTANQDRSVFPGKVRSDYQYKGGANAAYPHYDKKANVIMYRWAEAFLIFAEADNELNGPRTEAIQAINKIRHRAALLDLPADQVDTKEHFREAIRKEWRLEFVDEGKHFYNLQRWGILITKVNAFINEFNAYNPSTPMTLLVSGKNEIYPIPFAEIDRTHFVQNPGY